MTLLWRKTSRNTSIAVCDNDEGLKLLYKRSNLIKVSPAQIKEVYVRFEEVLSRNENLHTPKFYEELSGHDIHVYEYIGYPTLHQQMLKTSDISVLIDICDAMFGTLEKIHSSSVEVKGEYPYALLDFGPKNMMRNGNQNYIIDLPDKIIRRKAYLDYGVLWFEIDRSLIQTNNIGNFHSLMVRKISLAKKHGLTLKELISGLKSHSVDVALRYLNFFKNEKIQMLVFKCALFVPGIFVYYMYVSVGLSLMWIFVKREP